MTPGNQNPCEDLRVAALLDEIEAGGGSVAVAGDDAADGPTEAAQHVQRCDDCAAWLESARVLHGIVRDGDPVDGPGPQVRDRLFGAIRADLGAETVGGRPTVATTGGGTAGSAVTVSEFNPTAPSSSPSSSPNRSISSLSPQQSSPPSSSTSSTVLRILPTPLRLAAAVLLATAILAVLVASPSLTGGPGPVTDDWLVLGTAGDAVLRATPDGSAADAAPARSGDHLRLGDGTLVLRGSGLAVLEDPVGVRLTLAADDGGTARLRGLGPDAGRGVHLQSGRLLVDVPVGTPFRVVTAAGSAEVHGTRFRVDARDDAARVDVLSGVVLVRTAGRPGAPGTGEAILGAGDGADLRAGDDGIGLDTRAADPAADAFAALTARLEVRSPAPADDGPVRLALGEPLEFLFSIERPDLPGPEVGPVHLLTRGSGSPYYTLVLQGPGREVVQIRLDDRTVLDMPAGAGDRGRLTLADSGDAWRMLCRVSTEALAPGTWTARARYQTGPPGDDGAFAGSIVSPPLVVEVTER